jgi:hypothetical protein
VLKQQDQNILKVKSRVTVQTHKFRIKIPRSVKLAIEIDTETRTDLWHRAMEKEMKNNATAFEVLDDKNYLSHDL